MNILEIRENVCIDISLRRILNIICLNKVARLNRQLVGEIDNTKSTEGIVFLETFLLKNRICLLYMNIINIVYIKYDHYN